MDNDDWRDRIEAEIRTVRALHEDSAEQRATVDLDQPSVGRLSRMDALQQQAMAGASEARRRERLIALQAALRRLDDDEFGECEDCGHPIPEARLRLDPCARFCVSCASARED